MICHGKRESLFPDNISQAAAHFKTNAGTAEKQGLTGMGNFCGILFVIIYRRREWML